MDKYELRRQTLIALLHDRCKGKVSELAKKLGRSDSYVSRMLYPEGKAGKKRIGEDMAELIERSFEVDLVEPGDAMRPAKLKKVEVPRPIPPSYVDAEDIIKLIDLYRQSTDIGKKRILGAADVAPKAEGYARRDRQ